MILRGILTMRTFIFFPVHAIFVENCLLHKMIEHFFQIQKTCWNFVHHSHDTHYICMAEKNYVHKVVQYYKVVLEVVGICVDLIIQIHMYVLFNFYVDRFHHFSQLYVTIL